MRDLLLNKTIYLGTSFVLLLVSLPLISGGSTRHGGTGEALLWAGVVCMALGVLLLPVQRLLTGADRGTAEEDDA